MGVVPAMLAERLGLPAGDARVGGDGRGQTVRIRRDGDTATETVEGSLPLLLSR